MGELFFGVDLEFAGDVHVLRSLEDLGVVDIGDDGLIFAGEIFVEEVDEFLRREGGVGRLCVIFCFIFRFVL